MKREFQIDDIENSFISILQPQKFCQNKRSVIFTDKPVYKQGEKIYVTIYYYNLYTKTPLDRCESNKYLNLELVDINDKLIKSAKQDYNLNEDFDDYSSFSFSIDLDKNIKGGVYKINAEQDSIKIFVYEFVNHQFAVIGEWNIDTVKINDQIEGKLTLESFTKEFSEFHDINLSYKIVNGNGDVLQKYDDIELNENSYNLNYQVPKQFQTKLVFNFIFNSDGIETNYIKEFNEAIYDDIVIDFNIGTGKIVKNDHNKIYFAGYKNSKKILPIQINNAIVYSKQGNQSQTIIENINSNKYGKGVMDLFVQDFDFSSDLKYYLLIKFDDLNSKTYLIFDSQKVNFSNLLIKYNKLVINYGEQIDFNIIQHKPNIKNTLLVLQDKTKIYYIKNILLDQKELSTTPIIIDTQSLNLPNGGIYTLQLYIQDKDNESVKNDLSKDDGEIKELIPPISKSSFNFNGDVQQEIDIFIKPQHVLKTNIKFDKISYGPGNEVQFEINVDQNCQECYDPINPRSIIFVVNKSCFAEIDPSNVPSSIFTKIFLEKEIYLPQNEFKNNYLYIDYIFNQNSSLSVDQIKEKDINLELLLGQQKFRKFFLTPQNLYEFQSQQYNKRYDEYRKNFQYLLPLFFSVQEPRAEFLQTKKFAAPQQVRVNNVAEPLFNNEIFDDEAADDIPEKEKLSENSNPSNSSSSKDQNDYIEEQQKLEDYLKKDNIYYMKTTKFIDNKIKGKFILPSQVTDYLFKVISYDQNGVYGLNEKEIKPRKEFNMFMEKPLYLLNNENFIVELILENNTDNNLAINLNQGEEKLILMDSHSVHQIELTLNKNNIPMIIEAKDAQNKLLDKLFVNPSLIKPGITINGGVTDYISTHKDQESSLTYQTLLPQDIFKGNSELKICYKNSGIALILDAIEKLNRTPTGCFEQASSTSFPIVIALQILQSMTETDRVRELKFKLLENLKKGISLLLKYQTSDGGFEWFGKDPGHSTLTAYGLWQFNEIDQLKTEEVLFDKKLLKNLQEFFTKVKNNKGGWTITSGLDSLGNPPQQISDMYIVYVLSQKFVLMNDLFQDEFGYMDELFNQYQKAQKEFDSYSLALLGLYLNNKKDDNSKTILIDILKRQNIDGSIDKAINSITLSTGKSLIVETTALTMILLLEVDFNQYSSELIKMMQFLVSNIKDGYFGSTQATILSLLAFKAYLTLFQQNDDQKQLQFDILINESLLTNLKIDQTSILSEKRCLILNEQLDDFELPNKEIKIQVKPNQISLDDKENKYLFSLDYKYQSNLPISNINSPLDAILTQKLTDNTKIYYISIHSKVDKELGMVIYELYKPSCYDFNINDLENLRLSGEIDYYELLENNNKIVFYFRGMKANGSKKFSLSMSKKFNLNTCEERTHELYLYYDKEGSIIYKKL